MDELRVLDWSRPYRFTGAIRLVVESPVLPNPIRENKTSAKNAKGNVGYERFTNLVNRVALGAAQCIR